VAKAPTDELEPADVIPGFRRTSLQLSEVSRMVCTRPITATLTPKRTPRNDPNGRTHAHMFGSASDLS
jgi:hypothetical protein